MSSPSSAAPRAAWSAHPVSSRPLARLVAAVTVPALAGAVLVAGTAPPALASAADPGLAKAVAKVMKDSRVTRGTTGAVVLNATDGRELYARNGSQALTPASNTKLVTAMAALETLGTGYRFRTDVIRRGSVTAGTLNGNLYVKGYGDPTTRQSDLRSLAEAVRRAGITRVSGSLALDTSFFDTSRYNPTWSKAYADDYYAAPITPLTLAPNADYDSGTVLVNYAPGSKGKRAKISFTPAAAKNYVKIKNLTTTSARGTSGSFSASRAYGSNTVTVRGRVPQGRSSRSWLITVDRPDLYAAAVLRAELARAGVSVAKATKIKTVPTGGQQLVARDWSMPLSSLVVPFLKLSNNMHAEALTKAMGARSGKPGSWAAGLAVTTGYLKRIGTPMTGLRLVDGSGLTRSNKITARALSTALFKAQREPWFPAFRNALPVAGVTKRMVGGTLRYRMNGTRAASNARAKTGTLSGVTALSGYVKGRDGTPYVFSMISNYRSGTPRPVENTFVVTLANWRR